MLVTRGWLGEWPVVGAVLVETLVKRRCVGRCNPPSVPDAHFTRCQIARELHGPVIHVCRRMPAIVSQPKLGRIVCLGGIPRQLFLARSPASCVPIWNRGRDRPTCYIQRAQTSSILLLSDRVDHSGRARTLARLSWIVELVSCWVIVRLDYLLIGGRRCIGDEEDAISMVVECYWMTPRLWWRCVPPCTSIAWTTSSKVMSLTRSLCDAGRIVGHSPPGPLSGECPLTET